jgi:hypothetical protein
MKQNVIEKIEWVKWQQRAEQCGRRQRPQDGWGFQRDADHHEDGAECRRPPQPWGQLIKRGVIEIAEALRFKPLPNDTSG